MVSDDGDNLPDFTGEFDPLEDIEIIFRLDGMRSMDVVYNHPPEFFVEVSIDGKTAEFGEYQGYGASHCGDIKWMWMTERRPLMLR